LEHPQPYGQEIDLTKAEEELMEELKVLTGRKDSTSLTDQGITMRRSERRHRAVVPIDEPCGRRR
jgi:hypothetical protein